MKRELMRSDLRAPRRSAAPLFLVALSLFVLSAGPLFADYKDEYKAGVQAAGKNKWDEVAKRMAAAIREAGQENAAQVLIYGNWYEPYTPHFYLGLANAKLGNCEAAVREFKSSESQGVIQKTKKFKELQAAKADCEAKLPRETTPPPPPPPVTPVTPPPPPPAGPDPAVVAALRNANDQIARAEQALEALRRAKGDPALAQALAGASALQRSEAEANRQLNDARNRADAAEKANDAAGLRAAGELASQAAAGFNSVRTEALRLKNDTPVPPPPPPPPAISPELERRRTELLDAIMSAKALSDKVTTSKAAASLTAMSQELTAGIAEAERLLPTGSPDDLAQATERLKTRVESTQLALTSATAPQKSGEAPPVLVAAVQSFFNGDYNSVVAMLEGRSFGDARADLQAHLFLAAARFSLFYDGGQKDKQQLDASSKHVQAIKKADPAFSPGPKFFSPRFIEFFRQS